MLMKYFSGNLFHSLMNGLEDCGSSDDEQGRSRDQSPHGSASTTVVDNDLDWIYYFQLFIVKFCTGMSPLHNTWP